jgi:Uma2 family endonuclease
MAISETHTSSTSKTHQNLLVYEHLDGKDLYYKNYREVLKGNKKLEEIMGSSALQALIVEYLLGIFYAGLNRHLYRIFSNEIGVHISANENIAHDIAIYDKKILTADKISKQYTDVPAELAVEIDIKIDISEAKDYDYVNRKTQTVLDFGTKKLIWVFSETQKVMIAEKDKDWIITDWNKEIDLLEGLQFNIANYLKTEGIE